jgi:hypothetical protein
MTFGAQNLDCFPHGRTADAEFLAQHRHARQHATGRYGAGQDPSGERGNHLLMNSWSLHNLTCIHQ